jgi:hypothetical protein
MERPLRELPLHERVDDLPGPGTPGIKCVAVRIRDPFYPVDIRNLDDFVPRLQ